MPTDPRRPVTRSRRRALCRARRHCWAALCLALACRRAAVDTDDDKPAAAAVTCKAVESTMIDDAIEVTGVIAPPPKLDAIVSSPIAGRVGQVAVEEGDRVAAGALLAVIEDPALPAGSIEARAGVAVAQSAKASAELDLARQQRLVDSGIGARKDLDDARAKVSAASAELDAANARAGLATSQLARRELRAPRGGVVLHLWKRVGESVDGTTATPVAEVADLSILELHAQVPTAAMARLSDNLPATVRVIGLPAAFPASVTRVAPAVDPTTLLGSVRLAIDPKASGVAGVKVGSAATARVVIATRPGVVVPDTALRRSMVGADEVVVCDGNVARITAVAVGQRSERGVELSSGIKPGARIVVDHVLGIEDGQALTTAGKVTTTAGTAGQPDEPAGKRPADTGSGQGKLDDKRAYGKDSEGDDKAADEKPAAAKPAAAKPADDKAVDEKPAAAKPAAAKPADDKADDKPAAAKPGDDKPAAAKPATGKPGDDKPATGKPGDDKPAAAKPATGKPGDDKPATGKPGDDKPAAARPAAPGSGT
jgi:RND family efflux transporter MFP subunit